MTLNPRQSLSADGSFRYAVPPAAPSSLFAADCRHYRGDRPCIHNRLCRGCNHYEPYSHRILIIKLGALGDVIRTLCILPELRRQFPGAHITWVSLPNGCRMLRGQTMIDRLLPFDPIENHLLTQETFDLLVNLDKEPQPCALAAAVFARQKLGVTLSEFGTPIPANPEAHDYFALGLSDELKFRVNTKSYPQLVYEALGWTYRGQRYELPVDAGAAEQVRTALTTHGWNPQYPTLGINVGAGKAFANKMWPVERVVDVIRLVHAEQPQVQMLLLGGPDERAGVDAILERIPRESTAASRVIDAGTHHSEPAFVALIDACDALFSGDTMAMHVAIARRKGVVVFFGPTCQQEIELFGQGEKLVTQAACAPCYKRRCDHSDACVHDTPAQHAAAAVGRVLAGVSHAITRIALPQLPRKLAG